MQQRKKERPQIKGPLPQEVQQEIKAARDKRKKGHLMIGELHSIGAGVTPTHMFASHLLESDLAKVYSVALQVNEGEHPGIFSEPNLTKKATTSEKPEGLNEKAPETGKAHRLTINTRNKGDRIKYVEDKTGLVPLLTRLEEELLEFVNMYHGCVNAFTGVNNIWLQKLLALSGEIMHKIKSMRKELTANQGDNKDKIEWFDKMTNFLNHELEDKFVKLRSYEHILTLNKLTTPNVDKQPKQNVMTKVISFFNNKKAESGEKYIMIVGDAHAKFVDTLKNDEIQTVQKEEWAYAHNFYAGILAGKK